MKKKKKIPLVKFLFAIQLEKPSVSLKICRKSWKFLSFLSFLVLSTPLREWRSDASSEILTCNNRTRMGVAPFTVAARQSHRYCLVFTKKRKLFVSQINKASSSSEQSSGPPWIRRFPLIWRGADRIASYRGPFAAQGTTASPHCNSRGSRHWSSTIKRCVPFALCFFQRCESRNRFSLIFELNKHSLQK